MKIKVYYAHPISIYDRPQEKRDVATLEALGFEVVNPNAPEHDAGYKAGGMDYFKNLVESCGAIAIRALPDGSIPAGIAKEIQFAGERPQIELPTAVLRRTLSVDETRAFLREAGYR